VWNARHVSQRRHVTGWLMYSWANHGWETTVATVLAGPWLLALATKGRSRHTALFTVGPLHLRAESYPSLVVTVAALLQVAVMPLLGAGADHRGTSLRWLRAACLTGSVAAVLLAATRSNGYLVAGALVLVGSLAYGGSNVLYNAYLPQLADPAERDALSSRGFAYGYFGGGLLLAANLTLLLAHDAIGLEKSTAVRICFVSAGAWWAGFGIWSLRRFPWPPDRTLGDLSGAAPSARRRLADAVRELARRPQTRRYLIAYLLFSDAISAVIGLSSTFITHELFGNDATRAATFLFALILMIQFVAMGGAMLGARVAARVGAQRTILASLVVWGVVILYTYLELHSKAQAVLVGVVIGVVLGSSQALARSLWSQLVPLGQEATFFGLFEVANEGTAWAAPLLFTVVVNVTGSFRQAILSLLVLFVAGGLLLALTDIDTAVEESASSLGA
jgi:MFS transporter, UMF1 family